MPKLSLNKGESILIPELLYLGEIEESGTKEPFLQFHRNVEEILEFDIYINQKKVVVFGPSFSIETFKYNNERLSIHPFNYNIILRLSKHFMVGSCPYAFGQNDQNIFFIKEILTNTDIDELELSGIQRLFIAELKEERTNLTDISMLSRKEILSIKRNININKGEYILINLNGYQDYNKLRIMGFYYPKQQIKCPSIDDIYSKMKAIELFIADCSKKKRNYNCVEEI